jgi:hypothetical protein
MIVGQALSRWPPSAASGERRDRGAVLCGGQAAHPALTHAHQAPVGSRRSSTASLDLITTVGDDVRTSGTESRAASREKTGVRVSDAERDEINPQLAAKIQFDVPHSARIWNYWMGGKDNYQVDRDAGDSWVAVHPEIVNEAKQSRQFLIRVVRFLAGEAGIRQFLDVGTGLPTMQNTHEVAQSVAPGSRIVYVDNDPSVLAHARALLVNTTPEGVTTYVDADVRDPDLIVADARNVLNFNQPIAVMLMGILGHIADYDEARSIVRRLMASVPAGSYLALYDGVNLDEAKVKAEQAYAETGAIAYHNRGPEQIAGFFDELEMVEPGLVSVSQWRPAPAVVGEIKPTDSWGAVARKR